MVLWHVISCNIYNTTTADIPFRLMILCLWYTQPQDFKKKKTACNFWFDSKLKHRYWQYLIVQPSRSPPWGALLLITSPDFTYLCQPPGSGETQACVPWRPEVKSTNMHITVHTLPLTRKGSKYGMGALLAPAPSVFCVSCSPGFSSHSILPVNSRVRRQDLADLWHPAVGEERIFYISTDYCVTQKAGMTCCALQMKWVVDSYVSKSNGTNLKLYKYKDFQLFLVLFKYVTYCFILIFIS